jgi:hypothetical protein
VFCPRQTWRSSRTNAATYFVRGVGDEEVVDTCNQFLKYFTSVDNDYNKTTKTVVIYGRKMFMKLVPGSIFQFF